MIASRSRFYPSRVVYSRVWDRVRPWVTAGPFVLGASLTLACEREPSGVLQETVPATSHPPTEAFAARSIGTAAGAAGSVPQGSVTAPAGEAARGVTGDTGTGATAEAVPTEQACSLLGMVNAKEVSEGQYDINRNAVASIAQALQQKANTAASKQLIPARTEQGMPGLRVEGVGARAGCGLVSGDILVSINGISVTNKSELTRNREKLASAEELKLVIEREREAKVLTYDVGD